MGLLCALVTQIEMPTYADEYLQICCGKPLVTSIVGRLNRFAAPTLDRLWTTAPARRRILFVLDKNAEINSAGRTALLQVLDKSDGNDIAVASVEALSMPDRVLCAGHPRVYVERAAALAALGPTESAPEWRTLVE